jgi:hypothetical protein
MEIPAATPWSGAQAIAYFVPPSRPAIWTRPAPQRRLLCIRLVKSLSPDARESIVARMAGINGDDHHGEIARLEDEIDALEARLESCRKFILAGRVAVASGSVVLIAMLLGGVQFNSSVVGLAAAAVLGGIVAVGSNRSTAKEALNELTVLEERRAMLIGQLELRIVPARDH